ncbi:MAG: Ig-like domain-containing protein, partial [Opitutales bacterium]
MMNLLRPLSTWLRVVLLLGPLLACAAGASAPSAAIPPATGEPEALVSAVPMKFLTEGKRLSGQLAVAPELIRPGAEPELIYTIIVEPLHGQVALAGGEDEDSFQNKSGRVGYFSYQPRDGYVGPDSFSYTVRNENSGLVFRSSVVIEVRPPPPVVLEKFVVEGERARALGARAVTLRTRPNASVTGKVPSHEDFMSAEERGAIAHPQVVYALDEKSRPQHGVATLDRGSGQLTYAPNPDFIGEDRFNYYTTDQNNPQLGVENSVLVSVEPLRDYKHMSVDRSKSRQVDLVFVINNSPSMAPHQQRIAANLRRFRQLFDEKKLDYRIGVLTTDFVNAE